VLLDPVGANRAIISVMQLLADTDTMEIVTPATVLAKHEGPVAET
jgi:hypothetical protein